MGVEVRRMRATDIRAIVELAERYFPLARVDEGGVRRRSSRGYVYLVAEIGGEPAGFVDVRMRKRTAHVCGIAVRPECGGRGIGSALLEEAGRLAGKEGKEALTLVVKEGNAGAVEFYGRHGFSVVARKEGRDGRVLLMRKRLE